MKTLLFLFLLILLISFSYSQWTLDATLPCDSIHPPLQLEIHVIDTSVSWALGIAHRIAYPFYPYIARRTVNGWREITNTGLSYDVQANSFAAIDSNNAWLGTSKPGVIYFTSNGGANWIQQYYIADTGYVYAITFSKKYPNIGYAFASKINNGNWNGVTILKTTNSGLNWNRWEFEYYGFDCANNSMDVKDSCYAWFGLRDFNNHSKIIMTSTGGLTWNIYDVNDAFAGPNTIQFSSNNQTGLYTGSDYTTFIYRTTNSGINWTAVFTLYDYYFFYTMRWVHETANIYANSSNIVLRSVNNGLNWTLMTGINSTQIVSVDAVTINLSSIYALALTRDGKVYRFIDTVKPIGIENLSTSMPKEFKLYQNYPNPFNPNTTIKFDIVKEGNVTIEIYDLLGRTIALLAKDEFKKAGSYEVTWDGGNYPSGIYFYRLITDGFTDTKKMVLIK